MSEQGEPSVRGVLVVPDVEGMIVGGKSEGGVWSFGEEVTLVEGVFNLGTVGFDGFAYFTYPMWSCYVVGFEFDNEETGGVGGFIEMFEGVGEVFWCVRLMLE